ncbi:MAG: 2-hydroxyacyl-CoA dehydratase family protein [Thermodesulfobacteriota bacterium]
METIAYFDTSHDMPEEVIAAAGFAPYKILGDVRAANDPADRYLPAFFCPAARSIMTEALARSGQWAGIVVAQGCNATNRHYDVWKRHVPTPFLHWFNTPLKDDEAAVRFMKSELWRLMDAIQRQFGILVTGEMLARANQESNRLKERLRVFSGLRAEKDMTNREYLSVMIKSMTLPRAEAIKEVDAAIDTISQRGPFPGDKVKALLTGSDVTYPELMDQIDEAGFRVVRDDLSLGERYFASRIPDEGDPVESLARYYLSIPRPATKVGLRQRLAYLEAALAQSGIRAVISQNLKFCEPYAYDAVLVNNALKSRGYRVLHVEREYTATPDNPLATRLAAFAEMG